MLAFMLVLTLLLSFQIATNIRIISGIGLVEQIREDQDKVEQVVNLIRQHSAAISIREPDGNEQEITLGSEALFETGSADLSDSGSQILSDLVQRIVGADLTTLKEITVKGHTDDVNIKNERFASNWELSTARATEVVRFLTGNASTTSRIDPQRVTLVAAGYGQYRPIDPGNRQRNRRIELRLVYTNRPASR